jgi:hypothetical protein
MNINSVKPDINEKVVRALLGSTFAQPVQGGLTGRKLTFLEGLGKLDRVEKDSDAADISCMPWVRYHLACPMR